MSPEEEYLIMTNANNPGNVPPLPPTTGGGGKGGMPKWLLALLIILGIIALGCCGGLTTCFFVARNAAQKAGVSFSKDGVSVSNENGTMQFGKASLPPNFPTDIPVYAGLTPFMSQSDNDGGGTVALQGKAAKSDIVSFYQREMDSRSWKTTNTGSAQSTSELMFEKDDRFATVTVTTNNTDNSQSVLTITYSKKK